MEKDDMQKTYIPKKNEISNEWVLVDAKDQNLGRLATLIASILLGKNKPNFTPGVETGVYVVVNTRNASFAARYGVCCRTTNSVAR
jgi:ribosomal protein L13